MVIWLNNRIKNTSYDLNNESNFRTTITDINYDIDHPLPVEITTYLEGDIANAQKTETLYYFRQNCSDRG